MDANKIFCELLIMSEKLFVNSTPSCLLSGLPIQMQDIDNKNAFPSLIGDCDWGLFY